MPQAAVSRTSRLRGAVAAVKPPLPAVPRPIIVLGAGGIVRAAHLPGYKKANLPVIALADIDPDRAASMASLYNISRSFDSVASAVKYAPRDIVFEYRRSRGPTAERSSVTAKRIGGANAETNGRDT